MTLSEWQTIVAIGAGLLAIGSAIYSWLTGRASANAKEIDDLADRQRDLERRVDAVEGELRHLPDKDRVHKLEVAMEGMRGDIGRIADGFQTMSRTVTRIDEYLLRAGK
jgi:hypothetical protein